MTFDELFAACDRGEIRLEDIEALVLNPDDLDALAVTLPVAPVLSAPSVFALAGLPLERDRFVPRGHVVVRLRTRGP